jgi:hypothetical protein
MIYSLFCIIQQADNEDMANNQISAISCDLRNSNIEPEAYAMATIFEVKDIEKFNQELSNDIKILLQRGI